MKSVSIFCASSVGNKSLYREEAYKVGEQLAKRGIDVVFGGSKLGLMGAVADGALEAGGKVIGVLPHFMRKKEIEHDRLTELIFVDSMHERKLKMHELSEGVMALPGGFGTFEELFEMLTWSQLGLHDQPIGLLNIAGYYRLLLEMFDHMCEEGLLRPIYRDMVLASPDLDELLTSMEAYRAPTSVINLLKDQT
jgi:hypothetical protein